MTVSERDARQAVARLARESRGRLVALLVPMTRDLTLVEDALSDAFEKALSTWPRTGVPDRPEAWLLTVARNRIRDVATSAAARYSVALADPGAVAGGTGGGDDGSDPVADLDGEAIPDKRLELLFACAHPAIDVPVRSPLMLQVVLGFEAAEIAEAFDVSAAAMAQRLVRAKRRIRDGGVPFAVPTRSDMPERLAAVLDAVYGAYALDWLGQQERIRESLADEARWLAVQIAGLLPEEPEAWGLAALLTFAQARAPARIGDPWPPVHEQDTALWDPALIAHGESMLRRAHSLGRPLGRYQLEAAVQSVHCDRARTGRLDEEMLLRLYRGLLAVAPSAGARAAYEAVRGSVGRG